MGNVFCKHLLSYLLMYSSIAIDTSNALAKKKSKTLSKALHHKRK